MQIKGKIENGGEKRLKVLRIITVMGIICATAFVGTVAGEEWQGWTYKDSPYERLSPEWVQDVQQHVTTYIYDPTKDFEWRAQAQSYVLGWDDRITYVEEHGTINEETGEITYDWGFFGNTFGWGIPENIFQTKAEYDAALTLYNENYLAAVQPVPREV